MKSIVLLSGPVGAGKSTVAQHLVASSSGSAACIEGDKFWFFIAKGGESFGRNKNFRTIMVAMMAAAVPYAVAGFEVVLDFSIPPWFLDTARAVARVRDVPIDYVVLMPGEAVCAARAAARTEGVIADYAPLKEFYHSFNAAGPSHIIADDESGPAAIAATIRDGLNAGIFRISA